MSTDIDTEVVELHHVYESRGAARALMSCRDKKVVLSGPAGTGKSRACLEKLMVAALKYPGMRALIVRQVRDTLASTALKTLDEFVIKEQLDAGAVSYHGASGREPARYRFQNGSEFWLAGLDKPSKIMSSEFEMIYIQEATEISFDAWQKLSTRQRRFNMPYRQMLADCNPDAPTHWLKQQANEGGLTMLESRHRDNPVLYYEDGTKTPQGHDYLATLDELVGVNRSRLRDGLWVAAEGVIWGSYDPARHLIPRFDIPKDWQRIWSVDFGSVHPFVLTCWAVDGDGRLYRYREIHMTRRLVEDHAKTLIGIVRPGAVWDSKDNTWLSDPCGPDSMCADPDDCRDADTGGCGGWIEPRPIRILCDHDAEDRATLKRYLGMANHPADKRVKLGLDEVYARFRDDRLFFLRDSLVEKDKRAIAERKPLRTEDEIGGYVWEENKESPVKENDDGCDTVRYVVAHFDLKRKLTSKDRGAWV